jgi:ATP-dependent Clp protease ATP-binding subunit ClpB
MKREVLEEVRRHFRPEFINRIDGIVPFHRLNRSQMAAIVNIQVEAIRRRLAERKLGLEMAPAARDLLAERGWDPVFGARPLKRLIQGELVDRIARSVLEGRYPEGSTIRVDVSSDELSVS